MSTRSGKAELVVVGSSWGGLLAVSRLLEGLPDDVDVPIVVAQHRREDRSVLADLLASHTDWPVCEAEDKEGISPRRVYLAPVGYHLMIERDRFSLSTEGPVHHSRPSIDVLFESAADAYASKVVGVVLTGASADGADGARAIVRRGGTVVVQTPESSERAAMPLAAIAAVPDAQVAPPEDIGEILASLCHRHHAGETVER